MNHNEHRSDSALTRELCDSLSELAAPERPPLAAITSRGRTHRRRRLAGYAGLGGTGVAAGAALALGLTGVLGAAPARSAGTIRTAAFTLTRNANGTTR
jgi:ferric-dicitrate binding protein FerR (iron transport regulator)